MSGTTAPLEWPGEDLALPLLLLAWLALSRAMVAVEPAPHGRSGRRLVPPGGLIVQPIVRFLRGFGRFWYDFIVGDDPEIAIGVAAVPGVGAVLVARETAPGGTLVVVLAALLLTAFTVATALDVSRHQRPRA